jgi:hypothetical protein
LTGWLVWSLCQVGGQGQDALQDPDQDVGRGVAAVAFQVELNP